MAVNHSCFCFIF